MKEKKKKNLLKKVLKWILGIVVFVFLILIITPYLFKDQIKELVLENINKNVNATVSIDDFELSLIKKFPSANLRITDINIITATPFEGDTLFHAKEVNFKMKINELFKGKQEAKRIESFDINNGFVKILLSEQGSGNYDIAVKKESEVTQSEESSSISLDIQEYGVQDFDFIYKDESSGLHLKIADINHQGKGNFAENSLDLQTKTKAFISFTMGENNYVDETSVVLDALLGIDLETNMYTFKENRALINELPLEFSGFIQLIGENSDQLYDLEFHTPTSSFKNLLGVVPKQYAGNLDKVKTEGNFDIKGNINGILSENSTPKFNIIFLSNDAEFQYEELPKAVKNININANIRNSTNDINNTQVNVNSMSFAIDQDVFQGNVFVKNVMTNPVIKLKADGVVNLENISKAYPINLDQELSGVIKANIKSSFDMESVKNKEYQKLRNSGNISLTNFTYQGEELANPFTIKESTLAFSNNQIALKKFLAQTGETDLSINGSLKNLYGFLFNKELLKGDFRLSSNLVNVNDFMSKVEDETEEKEDNEDNEVATQALQIPSFLDCSLKASVKQVNYDNIKLRNATGVLLVKDESIQLQDVKMNAFNGQIQMNGGVSTKNPSADFKMDLKLENLDIKQSFTQLTTLNTIAPIANVIGGKMSSNLKFDGNLTEDMTPDLGTISGSLLGQLSNTRISSSNSKLISLLGNEFKFLDASKLNLEKVKTSIAFKDGNVIVKPFNVNYEDIDIEIGGTHGFDQSMNYSLKLDVPAKYFGKEVTNLLNKLTNEDRKNLNTVPVKADVSGSFASPVIKTDLKQATNQFIKNVTEYQKNKLVNQGKDKLLNLIGNKKDSSKTKQAESLLKGLFKKKKKNK